MTQQRTYGPFTWERREGGDYEVWELQRPEELHLTYFVLKNYGGKPGPGFKGWKLVSAGPFDKAGAYDSFDAALVGVTPWLVAYFLEDLDAKLAEYNSMLQYMTEMRARLAAL